MLPQIWHSNFLHLFLNEFLYRQFRSIGYYSDRKGRGVQSITISLLRSRGSYTFLALLSKTNIFVIFFSAIADGSHWIFSAQSQSVVPNYTLHLYNTYSTPVQHTTGISSQFPCCNRCDHILNPTQANNQWLKNKMFLIYYKHYLTQLSRNSFKIYHSSQWNTSNKYRLTDIQWFYI